MVIRVAKALVEVGAASLGPAADEGRMVLLDRVVQRVVSVKGPVAGLVLLAQMLG